MPKKQLDLNDLINRSLGIDVDTMIDESLGLDEEDTLRQADVQAHTPGVDPRLDSISDTVGTGAMLGEPDTGFMGALSQGKNFFLSAEESWKEFKGELAEGDKSMFRKAIDIAKSLHFTEIPKKANDAKRARWDFLNKGLPVYAMRPWSAEGEMVARAWPSARRFRIRFQAIEEAQVEAAQQAGIASEPDQDVLGQLLQFVPQLGGSPDDIRRSYLNGLEKDGAIFVSEEAIQQKERDIHKAEMEPWFRFNIWAHENYADKSWAQAEQAFLDSKKNGPHLNPDGTPMPLEAALEQEKQANALIEHVRAINHELGVDPSVETASDVFIRHGITSAPSDIAQDLLNDPLLPLTMIPVKRLSIAAPGSVDAIIKEGEKVGILPTLARKLDDAGSMMDELTDISSRPPRDFRASAEEATASFNKKTGDRYLADIDGELARDVSARTRVQAQVATEAREGLLDTGIAIDEDMADEIVALSSRRSKRPVQDIANLIQQRVPGLTPEAATTAARLARRQTAPMREWMKYLRAQERYRVGESGVTNRITALREGYEQTMQHAIALQMRAVEDLMELGLDPKHLERMTLNINPRNVQESIESMFDLPISSRKQGKILKQLTGYSPLTHMRAAASDAFFLEPRIVIGGTEAWHALRGMERGYNRWLDAVKRKTHHEFGFLRGGILKRNLPDGLQDYTKTQLRDLDERLAMALDGQVVGQDGAGGYKFNWRAADRDGNIVQTQQVVLTPDEMGVYDDARALFDLIADDLTRAGVRGFESGKPILDYFPRIYNEDVLPLRGNAGARDIPPELADVVTPSIFNRHLQPRELADRLASEARPTLTDALRAYIPAAGRTLHIEPGLKVAKAAGRSLRPGQQDYLDDLINIVKGKPNKWDRGADRIIQAGAEQFAKLPGVNADKVQRAVAHRPAYRLSLAIHNAYYRSLLAGMIGSGLTNLAQSTNTLASTGSLHMMRGATLFLDKRMRNVYKSSGAIDDWTGLFERTNPVLERAGFATLRTLDDIVMAPITLAEYTNRGISFLSGLSQAAKGKVRSFDDWIKLPEADKLDLIARGIDVTETGQFIYGRFGQAPFFSHALSKNATTLVSFPVKQAHFLYDQMKNDPSGLTRFFATAGWLTRTNRDMLGVSTEHALGFGFIPEDMGPYPLASPEISSLIDFVSYIRAEDPADKKRAYNRMANSFSEMLAGAIGGKFPPITLVAGIPREASGYSLGGPEIETDLGSRFAQAMYKGLRQLDSTQAAALDKFLPGNQEFGSGKQTGPNRRLIRDDLSDLERAGAFLGLRPEESRRQQNIAQQASRLESQADFQKRQFQENLAAATTPEQKKELWQKAINDGIIPVAALLSGGIQSGLGNQFLRTMVPGDTRAILKTPGLLASPEGQAFQQQAEDAIPPLEQP